MIENKIKTYIKKNIVPVIIEALFIISCFVVPKEYYIYTNFLFYALLFVYFICTGDLKLRDWFSSFRSGITYWKQVILTFLGFAAAFMVTILLENSFPDLDTGTIALRTNTWPALIIFFISTILLPAVTEETFYRKNMILLQGKVAIAITVPLSMLLYALEHSLSWWGILLTIIWALPLSIAYIKTKNIYVVITAHFFGNLMNLVDVVMGVMRLMQS